MNGKAIPGTISRVSTALEHQSLLLEAILAELRFMRGGMTETEMDHLQGGGSDAALRLDEFQVMRRAALGSP